MPKEEIIQDNTNIITNEMLNKMFDTFNKLQNAPDFEYAKKQKYYNSKHDILTDYNILKGSSRSNEIIISNYIMKFVDEESSYVGSNPVCFTSTTKETKHIDTLYKYIKGFSKNCYLDLLKKVGIYGQAYKLLYYVPDALSGYTLKSKIYNPMNSFVIKNDFDEIEYFFYVYSKDFFDDSKYIDLYTKDFISTYKVLEKDTKTLKVNEYNLKNFVLVETKENLFREVPVSICTIDKTIFDKIKRINDNLNISLSNNINISNDFRTGFMAIKGAELDEEGKKLINEQGVIYVPADGDVKWISRDINSEFALTLIETCIDQIYQQSCHLNNNEKNTSNTSGSNIRGRLIGLEQRCAELSNALVDSINNEIRLIFKFDNLVNNTNYSNLDVNSKTTINVPIDLAVIGDFISKNKGNMSYRTMWSLCPFMDDLELEWERFIEEKRILMNLENGDILDETIVDKTIDDTIPVDTNVDTNVDDINAEE
ncbi:phage portal protein [Clostridium tagluense]|uniref:phage portal protein n=1 Tax=Clostridium tagluense TaxID=360422 RepID=UPI001CF2619E|nr:phage portal protein [Clostridium tagluense]MCB2297048.1 phage portal protein [Clostridium tagluense]